MSDCPAVCIMIPAYNQAEYIGKAIKSALEQDYSNIQIVIADDNSTDTTTAIVQPFLKYPSIKYQKNDSNIGRVANYRKCLQDYTQADWVINLDGDDYFTNMQYISQAMLAIQKNGIDDTLFYQGVHVIKGDWFEKLIEPDISTEEICITSKDYFLHFFERNYFSHMSTLYNRQFAVENNFYSVDIISTDIFSFLGLCINNSNKKVIVSKNISGVWLQHDSNTSKTLHLKTHLNNLDLYKKLYSLAIDKGYNKWQCFKWLMKAGYIYLRSYFWMVIK